MDDPMDLPLEDDQVDLEGSDEGDLSVTMTGGIVLDKADRSISEFYRWYESHRLIVDPEWQRNVVWDERRSSRLIESFLNDIPVPVIYLAKNEEGRYEVIDGLQRLTAVFRFLRGEYQLRGLELSQDFNGKKFADLPEATQNKLYDTTLRTFELSPRTPKDLMFVIFERLNTGGIALNDMEIRNCLYRGKLNGVIRDLAQKREFVDAVNQRNLARRMDDRSLVLRFLAFYERTHTKARNGLKRFLNEFLETYRNPAPEKLKDFERQFDKAMKASLTVFGDKAFRVRRVTDTGGGEWASRVNASVFQAVAVSFTEYDLGQLTRSADAIFEEYVDMLATDPYWNECVRAATGDYARIDYVFTTWFQRLKAAIGSTPPNDGQRLFSRQLKQEMFAQNPTCAICNQRITLVIDAALDHVVHYWRGGQTIPENARLVHRLCNLQRPRR